MPARKSELLTQETASDEPDIRPATRRNGKWHAPLALSFRVCDFVSVQRSILRPPPPNDRPVRRKHLIN